MQPHVVSWWEGLYAPMFGPLGGGGRRHFSAGKTSLPVLIIPASVPGSFENRDQGLMHGVSTLLPIQGAGMV